MTPFTQTEVILLAVLAAAGLGYAVGRRIGRLQGRSEGLASAPVVLRIGAFEAGFCPICGQPAAAAGPDVVELGGPHPLDGARPGPPSRE
ncbi:MAG TPA: hypothetical protein VGL40_09705 [Bacillota bacterium]|jgi:hypothetical protein